MKHLILTAALALALAGSASAAKPRNVLDIKESLTDSAIVFPESFEQNTQRMLEGWYLKITPPVTTAMPGRRMCRCQTKS